MSYSGSGGNIVVPTTVSNGGTTYNVTAIGKGGSSYQVFDNSSILSDSIVDLSNFTIQVKINSYAFKDITNVSRIIFPSLGYSSMGYCFDGCGVTQVEIPASMSWINMADFRNCTSLEEFSFITPNTQSSITFDSGCLMGCTSLKKIVFPEGVEIWIKSQAFDGCSSLEEFNLKASLNVNHTSPNTNPLFFNDCSSLSGTFVLPKSSNVSIAGTYGLLTGTNIDGLVIGEDVTLSGSNLFDYVGISEVLNLSDLEVTTTSYGLNADKVDDHLESANYIGLAKVTTINEGSVYDLLIVIPVLVVAGILIITIGIMRRF